MRLSDEAEWEMGPSLLLTCSDRGQMSNRNFGAWAVLPMVAAMLIQFGCSGKGELSPDVAVPDVVGATEVLVTLDVVATDAAGGAEVVARADTVSIPDTEIGDVEQLPPPPHFGPPAPGLVATPTIEGPITTGNGKPVLLPPTFDLALVGYVEEEFFITGEAASYTSELPLTADGFWEVTAAESKPYTTRVIVRRPATAEDFDGTVVVEWFNVSAGMDAAPDWTFSHVQMIRERAAWVGVSAQIDGIEGDGTPLASMMALKNVDPVRYGPLDHPGDDFSYDMFSQAGAAVWFDAEKLLGGLEPTLVLAAGESQSAIRLTTYINAVAPLVDVYDGYLVHSRAGFGAPLKEGDSPPDPLFSRTDLEVPVLVLSTETDLVDHLLGYHRARQPDGPWFAGWEIAGAAHLGAYTLGIGDEDDGSGSADHALFQAMLEPPSSVYFGVLTCENPINAGPQTYVVRAGLAALIRWAREGTIPPPMPQLELDETGMDYLHDEVGNALGGIRTPQVDAPVARLSGLGETGWNFCTLFGSTVPLSSEELADLYPTPDSFVQEWGIALGSAVDAGAILPADALVLKSVAEAASFGL